MINFERLRVITEEEEWKKAYSEEIEKLDQLYQEEERLYYDMYTNGAQSKRMDELSSIKHQLMTNKSLFETLDSWKDKLSADPVWRRRLDVFLSKMKEEALDSHPEVVKLQQKLQKKLLEYRFELNGKEYNLGTVHSNIMENPDRELRKQLLLQAKKIGRDNEELFRTLIQKRNLLAKEQGYQNYYYFKCHMKEINIDTYMDEMDKLLARTKESSDYWDDKITEKFGWNKVQHYDQYFSTFNFHHINGDSFSSNRVKEVLSDIVSSLGLSMEEIPVKIETMEIPFGGFCININPNDLRLVVNKRDSYSVFLSAIHEMGHVLDGYYSSFQYPELYRFYSSIAAEGVAELFQTIITDKAFLKKNFNVEEEVYSQIKEINHLTDIKMLKMNYFYSIVEFELYNDPTKDFQDIANECYIQAFGYEGEAFHPASEMFYIENPAFFQDYNYALAIRDMIREKFQADSLYNRADFLQELVKKFIEPNQLYPWNERVKSLCGESNTFSYLAKRVTKIHN